MLYFQTKETDLGKISIVAKDNSIVWLAFRNENIPNAELNNDLPVLNEAFKQLDEYLEGSRKVFDLPLKSTGTDFQNKVWNELKKIPYGKTVSYGEIANRTGNFKAAHAVGGAVGANHIPIFIPCHRVIAANGEIGGYSSGLDIKRALLKIEGIFLSD